MVRTASGGQNGGCEQDVQAGFQEDAEHGATRFELTADSRTGALSLYEKVGMRVTSAWVNRAIDI